MSTAGPGTLLAGRYRLEDQVRADPLSSTWRAVDLTLERAVTVRLLVTGDSHVQATLDAARRAALVDDPRLQQVLGVGLEAGTGYVVLEWVQGRTVADLAGHVTDGEAVEIVREATAALRVAAGRGLHHGHLGPESVVRSPTGQVRVTGVAVDAAMGTGGQGRTAAESRDVRDLGAVLYALLTGYWPFGAQGGLPAAPTEMGRPVPPATVNPRLGPALDHLVAGVLAGEATRTLTGLLDALGSYVAEPRQDTASTAALPVVPVAVTPAPVVGPPSIALPDTDAARSTQPVPVSRGARDALNTAAGRGYVAPGGYDGWSLLPVEDPYDEPYGDWDPATDALAAPAGGAGGGAGGDDRADGGGYDDSALVVPRGGSRRVDVRRRRTAGAGTGVAVLLVMAAFVVGGLVWALDRFQSPVTVAAPPPAAVTETVPAEPLPAPPAPPAEEAVPDVRLVTPAGAQALDPFGDGSESNQEAPRAIDRDAATAWTTDRYNSQDFGGLKDGVGLVVDLGAPESVLAVQVAAAGTGGTYEVRAAATPSYEGSTVIGTGTTDPAAAVATITPEAPVDTQFLVIWFTSLPDNGGDWRALLNEVQVQVQ